MGGVGGNDIKRQIDREMTANGALMAREKVFRLTKWPIFTPLELLVSIYAAVSSRAGALQLGPGLI